MARRLRATWRTVSSAPWRRAPWLIRHHPGVLVTMLGAVAVVSASLAAVPLFLSSVGSETIAIQAEERCPRDTGVSLRSTVLPSDDTDPFAPVADGVGPTSRWQGVERVQLGAADDPERDTQASLLSRDAAVDHVEILEGAAGPGILIPDRAAERTGLGSGDRALVGDQEVAVAGVYRDLAGTSVDDYWCSNGDLLLLRVLNGDLVLPPPMIITDPDTFASLTAGADLVPRTFEAPLRPGLTITEVDHLIQRLGCQEPTSPALSWCRGQDRRLGEGPDLVRRLLRSSLPFVEGRARAVQTSVGSGIWPMAGFAALAGVGLVAAAASLWFDRRRRDVTLLTTRGVGPAAIGLKAALELVLPMAAGAATGVALGLAAVRWLGPSPHIEASALRQAGLAGLASLGVAGLTAGAVVTWRAGTHEARRSRRRWVGALPWELVLVAATIVSYRRLGDWGVPVGRGADLSRVDVVGLVFPVLFLVSAVAVLGRLLGLLVRPLRALSRSWPLALYLGVRRVARHRAAVIGLAAAAALSAGVLGYAATLNRSLEATLDLKAATFVGSDLAVQLAAAEEVPPALADRSTAVTLHRDAYVDAGRRESVMVLVVDVDTFERAALWDDTFSDRSLAAVLDDLAAPPVDGAVRAALVGLPSDGPVSVRIVGSGVPRFTAVDIGGVDAFPGMSRPDPTIVVARSALEALDVELPSGAPEVWIRGDREASLATLSRSVAGFEEVRNASGVIDSASFTTVSWTFGFMQTLGVAAGLLALGGAALYLDARRRERILGYTFLRRMGVERAQHRRALAVELVAGILVGAWVGLGLALAAAALAHERIDPVPSYRPAPVLRPAMAVLVTFLLLSTLLTALAAVAGQRRVDQDDPVEVLRAGV